MTSILLTIEDVVESWAEIHNYPSCNASPDHRITMGGLTWECTSEGLDAAMDDHGGDTSIDGVSLIASPDDDSATDMVVCLVARWLRDQTVDPTYGEMGEEVVS